MKAKYGRMNLKKMVGMLSPKREFKSTCTCTCTVKNELSN